MAQQSVLARIHATVALEQKNGMVSFTYRDSGSTTRCRIEPNGDIDLSSEQAGPVQIHFDLETSRVTLDGALHELHFVPDSVWIAGHQQDTPRGPYRPRGIAGCLARLGLRKAQFHHFEAPSGARVTFIDENNDHTRYKYTLRVEGKAGDGTTRWHEHDPWIHNR